MLDNHGNDVAKQGEPRAEMIAKVARSIRKRAGRLLGAEARPERPLHGDGLAPEPAARPDSGAAAPSLKLHLGCNWHAKPGYINVDIQRLPGVDVVADLEKPWPWKDATFDEIVCADLPEHLRQWYEEPDPAGLERARECAVRGEYKEAFEGLVAALRKPRRHYGVIHFMEEAHRVLMPSGRLDCTIPSTEGRGWAQDPTHVSYWNENSVLYFLDSDHRRIYPSLIRCAWKRVSVETKKPDRIGVIWFRMVLQKE